MMSEPAYDDVIESRPRLFRSELRKSRSEVSPFDPDQEPRVPRWRRVARFTVAALIFVGLSAIIAAAWAGGLDKVYAADAELRYKLEDSITFNVADRALEGQTLAIRSRSVLVPAATALAIDPDDLYREISVELIPASDVIRVTATAPSPLEAEERLNSVLDAYVQVAEADNDDDAVAYLDTQIEEIDARLDELDLLLDSGSDDSSLTDLRIATERDALLSQRASLVETRTELNLRGLTEQRVEILTPPHSSPDPVAPRPLRAALVAGIAASLVALLVAYLYLRRPQLS